MTDPRGLVFYFLRVTVYSKLIISPGAKPIMPPSIGGIDKPHIFSLRNVADIRKIDEYIDENDIGYVSITTEYNFK